MTRLVLSLFVAAAVLLAGTGLLRAADDAVTHEGSIVKVDKDQMTIKSADAQTVVSGCHDQVHAGWQGGSSKT
jgi:hypothetical protein